MLKAFVIRNRAILQSSAGLLIIFVVATLLSPTDHRTGDTLFLKASNLTNMLRVTAPVAIIALGMTLVILTAGIDLSVGSTLALSSVITAVGLSQWNFPIAVVIGIAMLAGGVVGLLNGTLIAILRVQPFVITLASMIGIRGFTRSLSNNENIGLHTAGEQAVWFVETFSQKSMMIGIFAALAILFSLILWGTVFGRYVRALGDNPKASVYAGLPIKRVQVVVYAMTGLLAGLAGVLTCARTTTGNPNDGIASELDVIAVVVIGGTSLAGGRGSIIGTVIGALIIAVLTNLLGLRNVDANSQLMLKAVIIVLAVIVQHRRVHH
ncbi:MAG: ABC transporter permease [Pirellulales bacterium]